MLLETIFKAQSELMHKYHPIELENNALETDQVPVDIQSRDGQARLRRFAWFIVEEISEALEAKQSNPSELEGELSDILHFMTEWAILSGVTADQIIYTRNPPAKMLMLKSDYAPKYLEVIYWVGLATNLLKGKPWKKAYKPTDIQKYQSRVIAAYVALLELIHFSGVELFSLDDLYFKKNKVNHERIQGGY